MRTLMLILLGLLMQSWQGEIMKVISGLTMTMMLSRWAMATDTGGRCDYPTKNSETEMHQ